MISLRVIYKMNTLKFNLYLTHTAYQDFIEFNITVFSLSWGIHEATLKDLAYVTSSVKMEWKIWKLEKNVWLGNLKKKNQCEVVMFSVSVYSTCYMWKHACEYAKKNGKNQSEVNADPRIEFFSRFWQKSWCS